MEVCVAGESVNQYTLSTSGQPAYPFARVAFINSVKISPKLHLFQ